jgi:hypothetical protein
VCIQLISIAFIDRSGDTFDFCWVGLTCGPIRGRDGTGLRQARDI